MFSSRGTVRYEERGQGHRNVEKVGKHCCRELLRRTLASGALVCKRAKFEVLMKNIVWYCVTSQPCDTVLYLGCLCTIVTEYSSAITRTFAINSVIVVAISHILSAIYWNSNESSGCTSGCNGGILL